MNSDSVFRFILVLGDSNAKNFKASLLKLVCAVLFDSHNTPKTAHELVLDIKTQYMLEFAEEEVMLSADQSTKIIKVKKGDPVFDLYSLRPEEYQKMERKVQPSIEEYVGEFISVYDHLGEKPLEPTAVKRLIYEFLYRTFDSDAKAILELIDRNHKAGKGGSYNISPEFTLDEKKIINSFLDWDYEPKNDFILRLISACFDYCMLTVKKDLRYIGNAIRGKSFYLDANIIFRLAGINKIERKQAMDAFISKCKNAGLSICYTNLTNFEIIYSIEYHVNELKDKLGSNEPLDASAIRSLSSQNTNMEFYEEYFEWCKVQGNIAGDYEGFKDYLKKKVRAAVSDFKLVVIDDYSTRDEYQRLAKEYSEYKNVNYKNTHEDNIKIDISNYIYMLDKNGQASDFFSINNYFITADHFLIEWAKQKRRGTVPIFVLPSVWYSILLKYEGRTADDYGSFCQFISLRIAPEEEEFLDEKNIILKKVLELDEDSKVKNEIIYDIEKKLSSDISLIKNIPALVDKSHKTVTEARVAEETTKIIIEHNIEIENKEREKEDIVKATYDKGMRDGYLHSIEQQASYMVERNRKRQHLLQFIAILALIIDIFLLIIALTGNGENPSRFAAYINDNFNIISLIIGAMEYLYYILEHRFKDSSFLSTDKDVIVQSLESKSRKRC